MIGTCRLSTSLRSSKPKISFDLLWNLALNRSYIISEFKVNPHVVGRRIELITLHTIEICFATQVTPLSFVTKWYCVINNINCSLLSCVFIYLLPIIKMVVWRERVVLFHTKVVYLLYCLQIIIKGRNDFWLNRENRNK